jgi:integrase
MSARMIVTVFKPKRRKNGKITAARMYRGRYRLSDDARITDVPLRTSDKQVATQRLQQIVQEKQQERAGIIPSREQRETAMRPLVESVADFIQTRVSIGRNEKYVKELKSKLLKLAAECSWNKATDITADSFEKWRGRQTLSAKTKNEYFHGLTVFLRWLERREKIALNPLRHVQMVVDTGKNKRERRAFTVDELRRLVAVAGPRGAVYLAAAFTGIRRGELRQLEWRDFHLDGAEPFVNVRASISKNHKQAALPLTSEVVVALRQCRQSEASPGDLVFSGMIPRMERFRKDLETAGIPYIDAKGEFADFHSLRKTFSTMLILAGVSQRVVMELMRHSDPRLTTKTYTDAGQLPLGATIRGLPLLNASEPADSQIDSQKLVTDSPSQSLAVHLPQAEKPDVSFENKGESLGLAALVPASPTPDADASIRFKPCTAHHLSISQGFLTSFVSCKGAEKFVAGCFVKNFADAVGSPIASREFFISFWADSFILFFCAEN